MLKNRDIHFVPWTSIAEWSDVREKILSSDVNDTIRAYEIITVWKLKHPYIPAYIECTCGILQVMIQEHLSEQKTDSLLLLNDNDLRLSYSTALIRFVNHVSSSSFGKNDNLYLAAKTQNIPDWVINLRHDAAHGQDLPALEALHMAADVSLKWLLANYWINEASFMNEFEPIRIKKTGNENTDPDKWNLTPILQQALDLFCVCTNARYRKKVFKISTTASIQFLNLYNAWTKNKHLPQAIKEIFQGLNWNANHYFSLENLSASVKKQRIKELKNSLLTMIEQIVLKSKSSDCLINALLKSEFLSYRMNFLKWTEVLHIVQHVGAIPILLKALFNLASCGIEDAVRWLVTLSMSIKSLKQKWTLFQKLKAQDKNKTKKRALKERAVSLDTCSYPGLAVHLLFMKPPNITLDVLEDVLMNPTELSQKIMQDYFEMAQEQSQSPTVASVDLLLKIYNGENLNEDEEMEDSDSNKIFTIEDLKIVPEIVSEEEENEDGTWIKSKLGTELWNKCAIGLLPYQNAADLRLPSDLKWKVRSVSSRKRNSTPLAGHVYNMKKRKS